MNRSRRSGNDGDPPPSVVDHHSSDLPSSAPLLYDRRFELLQTQMSAITQQLNHLTQSQSVVNARPAIMHVTPSATTKSRNSNSRRSKSKNRNTRHERSKFPFYAVVNGSNGSAVYTSWLEASHFCWDHQTQTFLRGSHCKGFLTETEALMYLNVVPDESLAMSKSHNAFTIPAEPSQTSEQLQLSYSQSGVSDEDSSFIPPPKLVHDPPTNTAYKNT